MQRSIARALHSTARGPPPAKREMPAFQPLGYFLRRAQALHQYRSIIRAGLRLRRRDDAQGADVLRQVRETYRRHVGETDNFVIKGLLLDGRRQVELATARAKGKPGRSGGVSGVRGGRLDAKAGGGGASEAVALTPPPQVAALADGAADADGAAYAVGTGWPWDRAR